MNPGACFSKTNASSGSRSFVRPTASGCRSGRGGEWSLSRWSFVRRSIDNRFQRVSSRDKQGHDDDRKDDHRKSDPSPVQPWPQVSKRLLISPPHSRKTDQCPEYPRESMDSQSVDQRRNSLGYCCRTFCVVCHSKGVLQCGHGLDRSLIESPHAGHGTSVSLFIHAFPRTAAPSPNRSTSQKLSLPVSAIPGRLPQNQRQISRAWSRRTRALRSCERKAIRPSCSF